MKYRMPERDPRRPFRDRPLDMDNYGIGALHFLILGLATESRQGCGGCDWLARPYLETVYP